MREWILIPALILVWFYGYSVIGKLDDAIQEKEKELDEERKQERED